MTELKKFYHFLLGKYFFLFNLLILMKSNVKFEKNYKINGLLFINNKGYIQIGKSLKANSGKNHNPIGGDTILRLITKKSGKLIIGDNCGISNSTFISANEIRIGNYVTIGGGCKFWDNDFHSLNPITRTSSNDNDIGSKPIIIKDYAFIGGGSTILKGVTIGTNSIIAAGSVVTKVVPDNEIWGGNPAKYIKNVC